jgi:eukaryotic-like serine/threonine-protein kinase
MAVDSVDSLVGLIQQHALLEPGQLEELAHLSARFPEPHTLAKELLQRNWLTAFQINQLFQGLGGDLLVADYVLLERLGAGGMGQVFKARHRQHGFLAALKLIHREGTPSEEMMRRFRREMAAIAWLDHPHIVRTRDVGELKDGTLYLAMEYLQGVDLAKLIQKRGPLHPVEACNFARQAALGLQHAHEADLVHRDIKPANLFVTAKERTIKILDFGLARLGDFGGSQSASTLTAVGHVMGTPDYIAPEQARNSHAADSRADLYSLGCTLYFLLVGNVPFPKGTTTEKLIQHQVDPPTPILELRPDTPPAVAVIVQKLMAKDPSERYQTAAEVANVLTYGPGSATLANIVLPELPVAIPLDTSVTSPLDDTIAETYHPDAPTVRPAPRPEVWRWLLVSGVALVFGLMLFGVLVVIGWLAHL